MEMSEALKRDGEKAAELFLDTMPVDVYERFAEKKLHHQLAYFFCWVEILKEEHM